MFGGVSHAVDLHIGSIAASFQVLGGIEASRSSYPNMDLVRAGKYASPMASHPMCFSGRFTWRLLPCYRPGMRSQEGAGARKRGEPTVAQRRYQWLVFFILVCVIDSP